MHCKLCLQLWHFKLFYVYRFSEIIPSKVIQSEIQQQFPHIATDFYVYHYAFSCLSIKETKYYIITQRNSVFQLHTLFINFNELAWSKDTFYTIQNEFGIWNRQGSGSLFSYFIYGQSPIPSKRAANLFKCVYYLFSVHIQTLYTLLIWTAITCSKCNLHVKVPSTVCSRIEKILGTEYKVELLVCLKKKETIDYFSQIPLSPWKKGI